MSHLTEQQLLSLPKLEMHIHLEGTFDLDTICEFAEKSNVPLPRPREELIQFSNLTEFLSMLDWICALVRDSADAEKLAYRYAQYAHSQGVIYTEVIVNPSHWKNIGLEDLLPNVLAGFDRAAADGLPDCRLLVSLRREQSTESAKMTVGWVLQNRHPRLLGLSIDGNEALSTDSNRRFAPLLAHARREGLALTVHAGESSGPEGVQEALDVLGAQRIDHGVRSIEDTALLEHLKTQKIPLNVCFTSNIIGELYTAQTHPLGELFRKGLIVTASTDDPMLLKLPLLKELETIASQYGWGMQELLHLQFNAVDAAFCSEPEKETLYSRLKKFSKTYMNG